jgi:hypothetical protein
MIHQAKSNPQLLGEQIFSERLASAISAIGPEQTFPAILMSAFRGMAIRLLARASLSIR